MYNIETDETCHFIPESSDEEALYPIEGRMNETIKQVIKSNNYKNDATFIAVSSLEDFDKSLQNIDTKKIPSNVWSINVI